MSCGRAHTPTSLFLPESVAEIIEKSYPSFRKNFCNLPVEWRCALSEMFKIPMENGLSMEEHADAYIQRTKNEERIGSMISTELDHKRLSFLRDETFTPSGNEWSTTYLKVLQHPNIVSDRLLEAQALNGLRELCPCPHFTEGHFILIAKNARLSRALFDTWERLQHAMEYETSSIKKKGLTKSLIIGHVAEDLIVEFEQRTGQSRYDFMD